MKILDRYIGKQVIITISIVTFGLLAVDIFFYFVNELRIVGKGNYTLATALAYIVMSMPRKLYIIFPWAALLGSLLALGSLGKYSELVAMRAATVSVPRIAWAAIKAGLLLTLIMFICGEVVSPYTEAWAKNKKTQALSQGKTIQTQYGTWVRHNDEFVHVGSVQEVTKLQHVTRYSFDDQLVLQEVSHAKSAIKDGKHWNLQDISGTKFTKDALIIEQTATKQVAELLDTELLQTANVKHLECLTLIKLWRVIKSRVAQDLNAIEYQRAFWLKMMQPFAALVMVFLAVPFAFGPLRSSSMGLKMVVGILMGFTFHTLNSIFGPLTSVVGLSPMVAAMVPAMVFLILGYVLVLRVR
ncbi:MAG TPA: LPS export ABC transporter permease LptG [Gammaproteobacteria bacterium]|nr:LPS export ABC transporter permease LptG [Gammaproteobacteria bacterium]